jgi:hypothetical protein
MGVGLLQHKAQKPFYSNGGRSACDQLKERKLLSL